MTPLLTTGIAFSLLLAGQLPAVTLPELETEAKLTPKRFAKYFTEFEYEYHRELQSPAVFLRTRKGDCDDYAVLADRVLRPKGYGTRLISIRMPGVVAHAVCYVGEEKGYLDYNNRIYFFQIQRAGASLREIASKVASSLDANWTSACEFTYRGDGLKQLVSIVTKTDPPAGPVPGKYLRKQIKIDF